MFKKIISIFIAFVLLMTCFAGCKKETEEVYLACAVPEMPRYFDPQVSESTAERMVAVNIFDGLFRLDENDEVQKCAVKDYKVSADGLVYTFYLNENLKYFISEETQEFIDEKGASISQKVRAQDFAFALRRAVTAETNAPDFHLLGNIKNAKLIHNGELPVNDLGVRAINDYTLEIQLEEKTSDFLYVLTQPVSFPCNEAFFNLTNGRYGLDKQYILSNGSFYLSAIKDNESVRFSKSEDYSGDFKALPTSVRLYVNSDEVDIAKKVDEGTYDIGFFTSDSAISELGKKTAKTNLTNISTSLIFNMNKAKYKNVNLRAGLVSAIDMSSVTKNPAENFISSYYNLSGGNIEKIPFNSGNAKEFMISAFEELKIDNLSVEILCTEKYQETAKAIVNSWQKNIGVELNGKFSVVDEETFRTKIKAGEYDLAIYPLVVDSNKTADFLSIFRTGNSQNIFGYSSEEYDLLVDGVISAPTKAKAVACESYLLKNAVVLPIQYEDTVMAISDGVSGIFFAGNSTNIYFYKGQTQ